MGGRWTEEGAILLEKKLAAVTACDLSTAQVFRPVRTRVFGNILLIV